MYRVFIFIIVISSFLNGLKAMGLYSAIPQETATLTKPMQSSITRNNVNSNIKKLNTDKYTINEEQSFQTTLEGFGKVRFVSTKTKKDEIPKNFFFLLDDRERVVYSFPDLYGNEWWYADEGIEAVAFKDLNKDGLKDVIIIAYYETGSGPDGAKPFPIADIYFQKKNKTFTTIPALDETLNDKGHNQTINDVIQYVSKQRINVN
ncbi:MULTISPECIES: hypothetical protein [unclassified Paenibacillus]|uniref:hypothetical protein n=1 Tax=unclassified Paenibacillus TaxID=185978 RepID=UPI0030F51A48